jgi:putative transcriptional regulator
MKISAQHIFKSKAEPKQGHLLLADPHLTEDFFERAVVLLIAHDQNESFGLVLNHQSDLELSDLFEHIELDLPIFNGGPVAQEQLFYLHRFAGIDGANQVTENLYFGGDWKEVLLRAHALRKPQEHLRLFAGYAGWGKQQLESELKERSWICTADFTDKALFKINPKQLWKENMLQQGPELALFANFPLNVSDN